MKPSITIDERGILLHVIDSDGHGIAVPLDSRTVGELTAGLARARARLADPSGRKEVLQAMGRVLLDLVNEKGKPDGA